MLLAIEKIRAIRNECLPSILKSTVNKRRESENTNKKPCKNTNINTAHDTSSNQLQQNSLCEPTIIAPNLSGSFSPLEFRICFYAGYCNESSNLQHIKIFVCVDKQSRRISTLGSLLSESTPNILDCSWIEEFHLSQK